MIDMLCMFFIFFFQAEDGIRDGHVTGVQTCALPILTLIDQRRRARELSQPDTFTSEEMVQTLKYFGESCALTGSKEEIHWDHVIPLSVGNVGTVKGNMIPLDAELNRRKSNLNIFEWFERSKVELGLSEEKFNILIDFLASENGMTKEEYRSFCYAQFEIKGEVI